MRYKIQIIGLIGVFLYGINCKADSQFDCTSLTTYPMMGGIHYTILGYKNGQSTIIQQGHAPTSSEAYQRAEEFLSHHHIGTKSCLRLPHGKMVPPPTS